MKSRDPAAGRVVCMRAPAEEPCGQGGSQGTASLDVSGPLPVATIGFSDASTAGFSDASVEGAATVQEKRVCVRRSFVPGPRYMRCAEYRSPAQARAIRALRARLFDG